MSPPNHCAPTELWNLKSLVSMNISSLRDASAADQKKEHAHCPDNLMSAGAVIALFPKLGLNQTSSKLAASAA